MFEGGRAICLGTRFRHDDIHQTTFIPDNDWIQIIQSAVTVDEHGDENLTGQRCGHLIILMIVEDNHL